MSKNNEAEPFFLRIIEKYDRGEPRDKLFTSLVNEFQLDLMQPFISQIETKIERPLTEDEKKKIGILEFFKYHSRFSRFGKERHGHVIKVPSLRKTRVVESHMSKATRMSRIRTVKSMRRK